MKTRKSNASIYGLSLAPTPKNSSPGASARSVQNNPGLLSKLWRWLHAGQTSRSNIKKLHVTSTVSLGEKRFVAVLEFDGLQYLVGGGATSVALLAQLNPAETFSATIKQTIAAQKKQPARVAAKKTPKPAAKEIEKSA
jgi:flagellar biogenesis protein FliO